MWAKPLLDGSVAVGLYNFLASGSRRSAWEENGDCTVRDLWAHESLGSRSGAVAIEVEAHGVALLKLTPA